MNRMRIVAGIVCAIGVWAGVHSSAATASYSETPYLLDQVKAGTLPPVGARLPDNPRMIDLVKRGDTLGRHGGRLRMLMGKQKDIRMMTVYGYARLVNYDQNLDLVPDILERFEISEGRIYTLFLRKGHKWSDGHPFTAEDFRFFWEDFANDKEISFGGPPSAMLVGGKPPKFEVIDETTVRYSWDEPNPNFILSLCGARPLFIYKPAHYLKQFHRRYQTPAKLKELVKAAGVRNWVALQFRRGQQYRPENPKLPTLQPWLNSTKPPAEQFIFTRNPFYHRTDKAGRQLPYIDEVVLNMGSTKIIPAKTGGGESDLQARYIRFDHYTFLKEGEKRRPINVRLWATGKGSQIALYPNLNTKHLEWRKLLRDVRFRRALSLGINRREINKVVYYGLVQESANTVLPKSPLFKPEYKNAWIEHNKLRADILLDEIGLRKRNSDGIRLMSDGKPLEIIVETAGESTEETDVLELIGDSWRDIGVKLFVRASQRDIFRSRIFSGHTVMSVWSGIENGIPTAAMNPWELAPTKQHQLQWPKWGQYFESNGKSGSPPDVREARQLIDHWYAWQRADTNSQRRDIWHKMLSLYTDQVFSIGIINSSLQPVVVSNKLRNVPKKGFFNWDPGAYFGIYMPDTFWLTKKAE